MTSQILFASERIAPIQTFMDCQESLARADSNTLVVFDIDDVLISVVDNCLKPEADLIVQPLIQKALREAKASHEKQALENLFADITLSARRRLTESHIPELIQALQARGVKTIGLTHATSAGLGHIVSIPRWRVDHLRSLGISFSTAFSRPSWFSLTSIARSGLPTPVFAEGILFSKYYTKGEVLEVFLKEVDWKPAKILFFDDIKENLLSVQSHVENLQISFEGFHCLGAKLGARDLDADLILYQWEYLMREGVFLNDEDARVKYYPDGGM